MYLLIFHIFKGEELEEGGGDELESVCQIDIIGLLLDITTVDSTMIGANIGISIHI
jgi:hypothetical protein